MGKKVEKISLNLCKSKQSGKLYIGIFKKGTPLKFWDYEEFSDTGKDFFKELINVYDLGYDIECQFPQKIKKEKKLVPHIVDMVGEPGVSDPLYKQKKEKFIFFNLKTEQFSDIKTDDFDIEIEEDEIITIQKEDQNAKDFLENYIKEKKL